MQVSWHHHWCLQAGWSRISLLVAAGLLLQHAGLLLLPLDSPAREPKVTRNVLVSWWLRPGGCALVPASWSQRPGPSLEDGLESVAREPKLVKLAKLVVVTTNY